MSGKIHKYRGKEIEVTFDAKRCIHSAECIRGLPQVFDTSRAPWITPNEAAADQVAEIIMRCPTGALHYKRTTGEGAEPVPEANVVQVGTDGPLYVRGDIEILDDAGNVVATDFRMALCRCGVSENKPYCDNAHRKVGFKNDCLISDAPDGDSGEEVFTKKLRIQPSPDGPLLIEGKVTITGSDGKHGVEVTNPAFCRCGHSGAKPYCDGSHNRVEFSDNP
ncbi:MAG: CDGSH iron-sulfur domain-containing protein [Candidatus Zixiibacteriota bacterium]